LKIFCKGKNIYPITRKKIKKNPNQFIFS